MKIFVVCVTYFPDLELFKESIRSLYNQVDFFIIVDNTIEESSKININFLEKYDWTQKIKIINLDNNYGIGYAQNIGIKFAIENNADYILTTDQDTIYPQRYIDTMLSIYNVYKDMYKIAAIAPFFRNINFSSEVYKLIVKDKNDKVLRLKFNTREGLKDVYSVYYTISSGMIIPKNVIEEIGFMNEDLFIDWVDTEWCIRANAKGYNVLQTPKISIQHKHGYGTLNLFKNYFVTHNYIRRYYIYRNGLYLFLYDKNLNKNLKFFILELLLSLFFVHLIVSKNKLSELKNKYFAIKDAFSKNLGPVKRNLIPDR